jgi:hypothetical protein
MGFMLLLLWVVGLCVGVPIAMMTLAVVVLWVVGVMLVALNEVNR